VEPCNRHEDLISTLKDHETRINLLEKSDVRSEEQYTTMFKWLERIENGVNSINKLIIGGMGAIILVLLSFFVWYVQRGG
jgi:hypothetical protein